MSRDNKHSKNGATVSASGRISSSNSSGRSKVDKLEDTKDVEGSESDTTSELNSNDDDDDDCMILEIKSFDEIKTNSSIIIKPSKRLPRRDIVGLKTTPLKEVFGANDLSIDHTFDNESCKALSISEAKPHEYVYIDDDDDDDDNDDDGDDDDDDEENDDDDGDGHDDYVIVIETKAFEQEIIHKLANLPKKLNLDSNEDDLAIIAERGQVACRDYPHSRHACAEYPFDETPHETHCPQCYCYVCDVKSPCKYWEQTEHGHCHASEFDDIWKPMRNKRLQAAKTEK